jgi:hypothetical protein
MGRSTSWLMERSKTMIRFSVTRNGRPLSKKLYAWNEKTKTFSTKEDGLVLDFTGINRVTFNTGSSCTFDTGSYCRFITGDYCTFNTGSDCTFKAEYDCTFNTDSFCTFNTDSFCTFQTGSYCTFKTSYDCTFKTGHSCTFNTGSDCTFKTGPKCTFTVRDNCFVTRFDVKGVTEIPTGKKIQLNGYEIAGYTIIEKKKEVPTCNGEVIEIDGKKYKLVEGKE